MVVHRRVVSEIVVELVTAAIGMMLGLAGRRRWNYVILDVMSNFRSSARFAQPKVCGWQLNQLSGIANSPQGGTGNGINPRPDR